MTLKRTADWLASSGQLLAVAPVVVHVPSLDDAMSYGRYVASVTKDMGSTTLDLLHAGVGVSGEAGEVLDAIKKHWAYEQPLNRENLLIEMGDLFFYFTAMMIVLEVGLDEIVQRNVNKLDKRYPLASYSNEAAKARADDPYVANSAGERKRLEPSADSPLWGSRAPAVVVDDLYVADSVERALAEADALLRDFNIQDSKKAEQKPGLTE